MHRIRWPALAGLLLCTATAMPAWAEVEYRAAVLRVDAPAGPLPISRLDLKPDDLGFAGAELGTADNATTGSFMGQRFTTQTVAATPDTAEAELTKLLDAGPGLGGRGMAGGLLGFGILGGFHPGLVLARRLADQHQPRLGVSVGEDQVGGGRLQRAPLESRHGGAERVEVKGLRRHGARRGARRGRAEIGRAHV